MEEDRRKKTEIVNELRTVVTCSDASVTSKVAKYVVSLSGSLSAIGAASSHGAHWAKSKSHNETSKCGTENRVGSSASLTNGGGSRS